MRIINEIRARSSHMETPTPRGFCGAGRRRAKSVAGTTSEPVDEPATQKPPALRVVRGRAPALLRRSTDVTASLFASRLAVRLARAQRRRFHMRRTCSKPQAMIVLASVAMLVLPAAAAENAIPDFSGLWARPYIGFEPPLSGPGPVTNRSRLLGQSNINQFVGDYTNPILKPQAAEIVKKHGELELRGLGAPNPSNQCLPMSPPYILQRQEIQMLQQKDQITILYNEDQQVRRVRLNARHPQHVIPSWSGDSIGRYEGQTLVIDTIGIKVGPHSMVDSYGTPQSEALHLVEHYW